MKFKTIIKKTSLLLISFLVIEGVARFFVSPRGPFLSDVDTLTVNSLMDYSNPMVKPKHETDNEIAMVGDSYVNGMGKKTFADLLPVDSYSLSGAQPRHYVLMAKRAFEKKRYKMLLVSVYTGNDINVPNPGTHLAWDTNAGIFSFEEGVSVENTYRKAMSPYMMLLNAARSTSVGTLMVNLAANIAPRYGSKELIESLSEIKNICDTNNSKLLVVVIDPPPSMRTKQNTYSKNKELFDGYHVLYVPTNSENIYNPRPDDHLNEYGNLRAAYFIKNNLVEK